MTFSPDGRRFAFLGATSLEDPEAQSVFIVSTSGGAAINRTPGYQGTAEWLAWLDSETIRFGATEGIRTVMNSVRADEGGIERIMDSSPACFYFPIAPSLDGTRRTFAAVLHSALRQGEVDPEQTQDLVKPLASRSSLSRNALERSLVAFVKSCDTSCDGGPGRST